MEHSAARNASGDEDLLAKVVRLSSSSAPARWFLIRWRESSTTLNLTSIERRVTVSLSMSPAEAMALGAVVKTSLVMIVVVLRCAFALVLFFG